MIDLESENNGSSREHLLLSQDHLAAAFQRYVGGSVCAGAGLRRFETDRDEHGSDGEARWDRSIRGTRLFRATGREGPDGPDGVDAVQFELEDVDARMFVQARTPLLA